SVCCGALCVMGYPFPSGKPPHLGTHQESGCSWRSNGKPPEPYLWVIFLHGLPVRKPLVRKGKFSRRSLLAAVPCLGLRRMKNLPGKALPQVGAGRVAAPGNTCPARRWDRPMQKIANTLKAT
ncbi:hypothetical protein, partial [Methyloparacoccus murrellii]